MFQFVAPFNTEQEQGFVGYLLLCNSISVYKQHEKEHNT